MKSLTIKMTNYLQLLRVHHWIKNTLIFIPLFFNQSMFFSTFLSSTLWGFICFSLLSSVVYIFNDIHDLEKDRLHSSKHDRPLASGKVPVSHAWIAILALSVTLIALLAVLRTYESSLYNFEAIGLLLLYLVANLAYSHGLKNVPIIDVTILAFGFVVRVLFGSVIIGVDISVWLYLMITMGAFYMGLGKRRNEMATDENGTRPVMRYYSHNFLDKNMYICQSLCVVFYALWSIDSMTVAKFHTTAFVYTIPLVFIILLKYSLNIETGKDGDPTSVLLRDRVLLSLCAIYAICASCILYFNRVI